jgi:hypothetical protein
LVIGRGVAGGIEGRGCLGVSPRYTNTDKEYPEKQTSTEIIQVEWFFGVHLRPFFGFDGVDEAGMGKSP